MLDILANNNWKHPIYFTGGASADEEYLWLKDYLQSDGVAYKFVPIKTSNNGASLFELGRMDLELNYDFWTSMDWKNINDGKIYLDTETRKNMVIFRNNMLRLVDAFIEKGDLEKAETILDLAMEKISVEGNLHYGMVLGYPDAYYRLNKKIGRAHV